MPKRDDAPIGAPCWIDIMTSDVDAARAFYGALFGWTWALGGENEEDYGGYANFSKDGVMVAGCMKSMGEGMPDVWSVYFRTDDAARIVADSLARGCDVIVDAMDVVPFGTMAVVTDPGGAAIGAWKPNEHHGFGVYDEPGTPGWFELHTRDYDKVVPFYRDVFGWDAHTMSDEPDFRYTTYGKDESALAGIMDAANMLPEYVPAHWAVYFRVENTDAACARITELGGKVVEPGHDSPYGRLAIATDTTGTQFRLVGS